MSQSPKKRVLSRAKIAAEMNWDLPSQSPKKRVLSRVISAAAQTLANSLNPLKSGSYPEKILRIGNQEPLSSQSPKKRVLSRDDISIDADFSVVSIP